MSAPLQSYDKNDWQFAWDATSISNFETCPRKYYLSQIRGLSTHEKSFHLTFGGHYATALETFHKKVAEGMSFDDAQVFVIHQTLFDTWEGREFDEEGNENPEAGKPWESGDTKKNRDNLIRTIIWYLEQHKNDSMPTVILPDGRAAVEYSFTVELSSEIVYCGHIDRLVEYSGGKYVQDQKTTGGALAANYFNNFTPDIQMSGYTYAGKIIFDLPISGVVIDAAQIAVGFTRFARGFVHRSPASLEEWREMSLATIADAKRANETGLYPMRRTSCGMYGGCEFRQYCSTLPSLRPNYIAGNLKRRPRWDPLKSR